MHLHLLQALQVITVLRYSFMRLCPLLQDLLDFLLAVHLHLLQTLQVGTVLKRQLMRLFSLLKDLIDLLLAFTDMAQTLKIIRGVDMVNSDSWFQMVNQAGRATRSTDDPLNVRPKAARAGGHEKLLLQQSD